MLDDFMDRLADEVWELEWKKTNSPTDWFAQDEARLQTCNKKAEVLGNADNARGWKKKLMLKAGLRDNAVSNVMPMKQSEADMLVQLGWQAIVFLFSVPGRASSLRI